jgi:hypothetical protein
MRLTEKSKPESHEQAQRKNFIALTREEMTPLREWLPSMEKAHGQDRMDDFMLLLMVPLMRISGEKGTAI